MKHQRNQRNWLNVSLLLVLGIMVGSFATRSTGQDPARAGAAHGVRIYTDRNVQELADLILRLGQANTVTDEQMQDIYAKIEGSARSGDLSSALIVFRVAEAQKAKTRQKK